MGLNVEIKCIWSSDVDDIDKWIPNDSSSVYILLSLAIGLEGEDSADDFQIAVGTPKGISSWANEYDLLLVSDRNLLVYSEYNWGQVKTDLNRIVSGCVSETWVLTVEKLQRYFLWEYEDYTTGQ